MLSEEDNSAALHADVLKIGPHESKNAYMPQFLAAVSPQVAIISAGAENPYAYPIPELLQRLRENGIRILCTDQDGAVQVKTDGHGMTVTCFVPCPAMSRSYDSAQIPDQQQPNE